MHDETIPASPREISEQATVKVSVASNTETLRLPPKEAPQTGTRNQKLRTSLQIAGIIILALIESGLLIMSLVPSTKAAQLGWSATNGPFPTATVPLITAVFYLTPLLIGLLAQRWEVALVAATFPAWLGIGIYSVASSTQDGIFAMTAGAHPTYLVGTMELFAALGGFGWLTRRIIFNEPTPRS